MALKERDPKIQIILADPMGSALYSWVKTGELKAEGSSITEGIGQGRVPGNLENVAIDDAVQITDDAMLHVVFDLLKHQGLCVGGSAGLNVAASMQIAFKMGPGHRIATILCDGGERYRSKIFNPVFLAEKGLPSPPWLS
jgi:cysteine synthase A